MNSIILSVFLFLLLLFLCICVRSYIKYNLFYRYKDVICLFELFLEKSYDLIYQNSLITYVSEGVKNIPSDEKETIERNFVKQTILLLGQTNEDIICKFFGSRECAINYMVCFIRKRFADDGIAKIIKTADET